VRASGLTDHEHRREEAAAPALGAYHSTGELAAYDEADEPKRQGDRQIPAGDFQSRQHRDDRDRAER
jgi:hypothetical protein